MNKKMMSVLITMAITAGLLTVPAHADTQAEMTVSAPKYYRVIATKDADGYDAFEEVEALTDGKFTKTVSWDDNGKITGALDGTFKTEVDIADGNAKNATLYGAVYDAEKKLVGVVSDSKAAADATDKLSVTANVGANQTFKNFIWDVEGGIKPIEVQDKAPEIRYFYCDDPNTVTVAWYNEGGNYTVEKNGETVDISGIATIGAGSVSSNMGRYSVYVYTDASAKTGDKYVVKNNGVASDELVADFTEGASITLGKYLMGRNMAYLRNDNAQWWHETVSDHMNIEGRECDAAAHKVYNVSTGKKEKWTSFFFKVDKDYISGEGNAVDVTIDYFDYGTGTLRIKNAGASSEGAVITVATLEDTKTWKTVTYRLTDVSFLADTCVDGDYQLRIMTGTGSAIGKVTVEPIVDTTIKTLRAANTYIDGVELRWTVGSEKGITGYTVKRNGETIATNYQKRTYFDRNLADSTTYTYTVTPELAEGEGIESTALTVTTEKIKEVSMTLPLVSGYEKNTSETSNNESQTAEQYTDGGGLTFGLYTNDRWNEGMTLARQKEGKWGRTTLCRNTGSGTGWYEVYTYASGAKRGSSFLSFQVDNSIISADTRNLTVEFEYFDNGHSDLSGQRVELTYLAYNNGGTPTKKTVGVVGYGRDGKWKTAKVVLTDAQFDHSNGVIQGGYNYDFRLGSSTNRGGLTVSSVRVYANNAVAMPEHEICSVVNADGTALEGDLVQSIWTGSYDRNIGFSGNNTLGLTAVEGKHYTFNHEYLDDGGSWRRWKNSWFYNIPDDFLSGTDYENVKIAVEYYLPGEMGLQIVTKNASDGKDAPVWAKNSKNVWETHVFEYKNGSANFAGDFAGCDFKFEINGQGYIHKVTVTKDIIED